MRRSQPTSNNAPVCILYHGYRSRSGSGLIYQNLKVPAPNKHSHPLRHFVISCLTMADGGGRREISPKTPIFILACSEAKPTLYCNQPCQFSIGCFAYARPTRFYFLAIPGKYPVRLAAVLLSRHDAQKNTSSLSPLETTSLQQIQTSSF